MKIILFVLFNIIILNVFSQSNSLTDTIKYELVGLSRKDCINKFKSKLDELVISDSLNISLSDEKDIFKGKGKLEYNHIIDYDTSDAFINKTYTGQVLGNLVYNIRIEFQKKVILVTLKDFEHIAKGNKYGKRSLGKISFSDIKIKTKDEELIWLEKVRIDIVECLNRVNVGFKLWFFNSIL